MFVVRTRRRKDKPFRRGIKAHVKQGDVWTTCVCRHSGEDAEVIAKVKTNRVIVYEKTRFRQVKTPDIEKCYSDELFQWIHTKTINVEAYTRKPWHTLSVADAEYQESVAYSRFW